MDRKRIASDIAPSAYRRDRNVNEAAAEHRDHQGQRDRRAEMKLFQAREHEPAEHGERTSRTRNRRRANAGTFGSRTKASDRRAQTADCDQLAMADSRGHRMAVHQDGVKQLIQVALAFRVLHFR